MPLESLQSKELTLVYTVALDINYPQFSNRSNSTQRVNKELRAIISQLPNLMCMQVSGMRPALSSLLRDQPDLAARMTVLHLSDLGNPMSNKTPEPDLGFLTFIKDARQLKTLVITAIDELGRSSDIESWWTSVLAPRSHPIALSLTNPPVLPQSLPSEPSDDTTESAEGHNTSGHLKHLHLNYSRRDGALDTVLRLRSMCDHFSILTTLELAGIRDWVADSALQRAALPALELLALDSISALTTDPTNRLTSLLHHWSPKKLRLGACPGFTTTELKAALASPLAASLQMVELLTGTVGLFENLESLIDFQEDLNGPPRRLEVGFDPHMIPLLEAKAIFDGAFMLSLCILHVFVSLN